MMETPLVSICCITFNHEPYIRQCIEGFLMQKTTFPFEIIIHDDASTDNTANIIREYEAKYPDIIKPIYQTENQYSKGIKISATYNYPRAKGKYIAICEGDDYWIDPLKLQKQVDFLESNKDYSMCFHNAIKLHVNQNRIELFNILNSDCDLSEYDAIHNWIVPSASIVGKTEVLSNHPNWLSQIYSGDYSMILIAMNRGKVRYLNELMSVYRINNTGSSMTAQMANNNIFVLEQKIKLLDSFNSGTNGKFNECISKRIDYLKYEHKFQLAIKNKHFFVILSLWNFVFKKMLKKTVSRIRKYNNI